MKSVPWRRIRLGEVARIKHGFAFTGMSADVEPPAPIVIGIGNFDYAGGFRFQRTTVKRLRGEWPAEFLLAPGDLLLAMTCQTPGGEILGVPGRVPDDGVKYLHNQRLGKVQVLGDALDVGFAFHMARWSEFNRHLVVTASGSKILHTSPSRIEEFEFGLPPIDEQKAIAATLDALDHKINLNESMRERCFQLSRLHFQVASASAGRSQLGQVASLVLGGTPNRRTLDYWIDGEIPWINSGEANRDIIMTPTEHITEVALANSAAKIMPRGATVVAITGATLGQVALLGIEAAGNQSLVGVWADDPALSAWLHFAVSDTIPTLIERSTGAAQQHVNKGDVAALAVPIPSKKSLGHWYELCGPLMERALALARESDGLAQLRGTLIPALMDGRLRSDTRVEVLNQGSCGGGN